MAGKASGLQTLQDAGDLRGLPNGDQRQSPELRNYFRGVHRNRALSLQKSIVRFPEADPRFVDLLRRVNIQQGSARAPRRMPCPSRKLGIRVSNMTFTGETFVRFQGAVRRAEDPKGFWWDVALYYFFRAIFIAVYLLN